MEDQPTNTNKPKKGYGKRSIWFWIGIYLIFAIVVYGAVYLIIAAQGGDSSDGGLYGY